MMDLELINTIVEQGNFGVVITDLEGNIQYSNEYFAKLHGYIPNDLEGKNLRIFHNEEQMKQFIEINKRFQESGSCSNEEIFHTHRNGSIFPMLMNGMIIKDASGKSHKTIVAIDILKSKKAEKELLKEKSDELETIFDNIPALIFYKDTKNKFLLANKVLTDAYHMKKGELNGKSLFDMFPHDEAQAYWDDDLAVINSGKPRLNIVEKWETDESLKWVNTNKIPLKNKEGNIIGILGFSVDITEQKNNEELIKARNKELEEIRGELVRKEKFAVLGQLAGGVGHELRNPLGTIKNAAYFLNLAIEKPTTEVKESLEIIDSAISTCETIITSLLRYSRHQPPLLRKSDINQIILDSLSSITISEKIKVVKQLDEKVPKLSVDPDQLIQAFGNIIINAVQAMSEVGTLIIKSETSNSNWITVSFTDTGIGISEENKEKLFEPLFTTKAKGIGLGLAITKIFVDGHGGLMEVVSEVGKGTTISIKFPIRNNEEV